MSVLADTLARVVAIREALACGDLGYAATLLAEIELDLAALDAALSEPRPVGRAADREEPRRANL